MSVADGTADREAIEDEAIAWFVACRGDLSAERQATFDAWFARSPEHRRAYAWAAQHYNHSALLKRKAPVAARPAHHRRGRAALLAAPAMLLLLVSGFWLWPQGNGPAEPVTAAFAGNRQGIRYVTLDDGTILILAPDAKLSSSNRSGRRHVTVTSGLARITVPRPGAPMSIANGPTTVELMPGSTIDIDARPRSMNWTLRAGQAAVRIDNAASQSLIVGAEHRLEGGSNRLVRTMKPTVDRIDWPTGWAEYRSVSLSALIADANRLGDKPIELAPGVAAGQQVTGRFRIARSRPFARRLALSLGLSINERSDALVLTAQK
ncbi:DUF4880 domain-containing protein [Sphingomonas sp. FW199]|uniref:FecR family protein n=1 Tax=Sphingomonas sp. FW199 TaxID=3400217 RepID=UPI003CF85EE1